MVITKIITLSSECGYPLGQNPVPESKIIPENEQIFESTTTIYFNSTTEPYITVNPSYPNKIITVWQQSRFSNGGCLEAGIAYSSDYGKTWERSLVPFQVSIGGISQRISDLWIVYNNEGTKVFLNVLYLNATFNQNYPEEQRGHVIVESLDDGKTWSNLKFLSASKSFLSDIDSPYFSDNNNMISIDPENSSNLYNIWDRFKSNSSFHSDTFITRSTNSGKSWFPAYKIYDATLDLQQQGLSNGDVQCNQTTNELIYRLPKIKNKSEISNDLIAIIPRIYSQFNSTFNDYSNDFFPVKFTYSDICIIRSKDNGITWDTHSTIITNNGLTNCEVYTGGYEYNANNDITAGLGTQLRTGNNYLPMGVVNNNNGNIYLVLQSSTLREDLIPQIGLVTSKDGGYTWSPITRVNKTPQNIPNPSAFTPSIAISDNGYIGIMYYDFRFDDASDPERTKTDGWLAIYKENRYGELEFIEEIRISNDSWIAQWGPTTGAGVMTNGDYSGLVSVNNYFYAVFTKTSEEPVIHPTIIFEQQIFESPTIVKLDVNPRTQPYVTVVQVF